MFEKRDKKEQKKEPRFIVKEEQEWVLSGALKIVLDTRTGVNYLLTVGDGISGITPLLDENGQVVIDKNMPKQNY